MTGKYIRVQTVGIDEVREIGRKGVKVGGKENEGNNFGDGSEKQRDIDYHFSLYRSNLGVHNFILPSVTSN